ncbi:MAG TPA: hypothetical protein VLE69_01405 [Candidatus Saccharimonadales bacterium]|nr:hypothetical protein [Candidatus Saccharimonadales bacterium]
MARKYSQDGQIMCSMEIAPQCFEVCENARQERGSGLSTFMSILNPKFVSAVGVVFCEGPTKDDNSAFECNVNYRAQVGSRDSDLADLLEEFRDESFWNNTSS